MYLRSATVIFLAAAVSLAVCLPLSAQKSMVDPGLGIEIKPPKGWTQMPAFEQRGQRRMFAVAPKALSGKAEGVARAPFLEVLFLEKGLEGEDEVDGLPRATPFRDLEDWLERGHRGQVNVETREGDQLGDFAGDRVIATVSEDAGDRVLYGASIELDDGQVLVFFDVLAEHFDKERKKYERALDSIGKVERAAEGGGLVVPPWRADAAGWSGLDASAKEKARSEFASAVAQAASAAPGLGWKEYKNKTWTVLSSTGAGFTKKAITAASAARAWCQSTFPGVADAPALPAVLRVFASPDQYRAFRLGDPDSREYSADRRELYFYEDPDAGTNDGYGMLFRAVLWHYLDDADADILSVLPRWLDNGLWEYLRSTRCKGKKIEFFPSDVEKGRIDYQKRADSMPPIWNLIQGSMQPSPENGENEDPWGFTPECARVVRWICDYDGAKAFDKPDLLSAYFLSLADARRKVGPDPMQGVDLARLDEDGVQELNRRFYKWRDSVLLACNDEAIPLSIETWHVVNGKWLQFNADFK